MSLSILNEAIASFLEVYKIKSDIYYISASIEELHEFLTVENTRFF
ncbi:MAG: hypothetical protein V7K69_12475 [Nostoc sp.]